MRFALAFLLVAVVSPASSIDFTGDAFIATWYNEVNLHGTGFDLTTAPSDGSQLVGVCTSDPCIATGVISIFSPVGSGYWSTTYEGTTLWRNYVDRGIGPGGFLYGTIQFSSSPFLRCMMCSFTIPMTFTGEVWAQFPDNSYLYDLALMGSGSLRITHGIGLYWTLAYSDPNVFLTGSATSLLADAGGVPEPSTWLLLATVTVLSPFAFRRRLRTR